MKTLPKKFIFLLIIILIAIGAFGISYKTNWLGASNKSVQGVNQQAQNQKVVLAIDDGKNSKQTIEMNFQEGQIAFGVLKNGLEKLNLQLKTKDYENLGVLVESIGGIENGQEGKYWLYYINGQMPLVSADKQEVSPGDNVEFKFEKSQF